MVRSGAGSPLPRGAKGPGSRKAGPKAESAILRILATSDLHMHLLAWDYFTDRPARTRGLSLLAGLIERARAEVPQSILVDNGDFLQGSPLGDLLAETSYRPPDGLNPMIAAMNHLAYDAAALGNHEFSHGLAYLKAALPQARFPILSANILRVLGDDPSLDQPFVTPTALLARHIALPGHPPRKITIGLVGLTPVEVVNWESEALRGHVVARDMIGAAAHHLKKLRSDGADLVIALAHSGLGDPRFLHDQETSVLHLAQNLEFDAIVAGHTHMRMPGPDFAASPQIDPVQGRVCGRPTVMPGFFGSHLGVIDLHLEPKGASGWTLVDSRVALRPVSRHSPSGRTVATVREDPAILAIASDAHDHTRRWSRRKIGETSQDLTSFFSLIGPTAAVRLVARAQADHIAQMVRGTLWMGLPILSAAAPFRCGGRSGPENFTHIAAGPLSLRNISDLYLFPNTVIALALMGHEVADWLERAAAMYHQIAPGSQDAELIDQDMPGFEFDQIEGLDYDIDLTRAAKFDITGRRLPGQPGRVRNITQGEHPLNPEARYILVTNSYRLGGGGRYDMARDERVILRGGQAIRAILASYVAQIGRVQIDTAPNWRLTLGTGGSVTFRTSPLACTTAPEVRHGALTALDLTADGFRRFRLTL